MSKSLGNYIGIAEPPGEIYGKVMSLPDHLITDYFLLATDVPDAEIAELTRQLDARSVNPMTLKKRLAYEIVAQFHGASAAREAEEEFTRVFQQRERPEEIPEHTFAASPAENGLYRIDLAPTLIKQGIIKSNSELKRLLAQGAVELDGAKISTNVVTARSGSVLKIGKHTFVRIAIEHHQEEV